MDCGDGVTVNVCSSDDDCSNSDNGPKLATACRPELFAYSDSDAHAEPNDGKVLKYVTNFGDVTVNLLHPHSYEILAKVHDSIISDVGTSDNTDLQNSTKTTIENMDNNALLDQKSKTDSGDHLKNGSQKQHQVNEAQSQLQHRESISCGFEESTEVLLINSADCNDKYFGSSRAYSATDSDVEVLMSEEIGESDWSAGGTQTGDHTPEEHPIRNLTTINVETSQPKQCKVSGSLSIEGESTDQEISIEVSSHNSLSVSEHLDKDSLLKIIGEQAASIHKLKRVVEHYRRAHLMLYKHAEAIQFTIDTTDEDLEKLGLPQKARP